MLWLPSICLSATLNFCNPFERGNPFAETKTVQMDEPDKVIQVAELIDKYAEKRDIDPNLIAAIMYVESRFGEVTISHSGRDHGPMQINDWWFKRLGITKKDVVTLEGGLKWGTKILEFAREEHKGNGCWWSLYNSRNPHARKRYESKVKAVFANVDMKPNCTDVKTTDSSLLLVSATASSSLY